jgi:hypothetical protein
MLPSERIPYVNLQFLFLPLEVQQQAVARRIAEAAKTATRSQNSHEI